MAIAKTTELPWEIPAIKIFWGRMPLLTSSSISSSIHLTESSKPWSFSPFSKSSKEIILYHAGSIWGPGCQGVLRSTRIVEACGKMNLVL
jgi:hypothetical protein